jgi:hypothetical protein
MEVVVCIVLTVLSSISGLFMFDMQRENIYTNEKLMQLSSSHRLPVYTAEISVHIPVSLAMPVCPFVTVRKKPNRFSGELMFVDTRNRIFGKILLVAEITVESLNGFWI